MKFKAILIVSGAASLWGCGPSEPPRPEPPEFIQKLIDAPFPADGELHVRTAGKFNITPTTWFCGYPIKIDPGLEEMTGIRDGQLGAGPDIDKELKALGQTMYIGGGKREDRAGSEECKAPDAFHTYYATLLNRDKRPYRIITVLWQGSAYWIGHVERTLDLNNIPGDDPIFDHVDYSISDMKKSRSQLREEHDRNIKIYKVNSLINRDGKLIRDAYVSHLFAKTEDK